MLICNAWIDSNSIFSKFCTQVDWSKVKFVFCDERLVPFDDADSTYGVYKNSDIFKLEVI